SQYLRDQGEFENFLIGTGIEDATLELGSGEVRAGSDLRAIVNDALAVRNIIEGLHSRYPRAVGEQAAIASALPLPTFAGAARAEAAAEVVARRLDAIAEETERGWQGRITSDDEGIARGFIFERTVRGVKEVAMLDAALIGSADARALDR